MARLTNLSERGIETQRMLSDVLMQLLGETNYNKISVKDITVRAGIDRSTFYLHFKDKDDLFLAAVLILAGLAALLFALPEPESSQRVATLAPTLFQPFQGVP